MRHRLVVFIATCTLALFVIGTAGAAPLAAQTSSATGVTIQATPLALAGPRWEFEIVLTTHSGALDDDLAKSASLAAGGGAGAAPLAWRGDPPGGHHRKGVLEYAPLAPRPASIELRIQRAGERGRLPGNGACPACVVCGMVTVQGAPVPFTLTSSRSGVSPADSPAFPGVVPEGINRPPLTLLS